MTEQDRQAPAAEQQQPRLQGQLAAEAIAQRARGEQQAGEHEQIAVHHPLQRGGGGVELLLQAGERDVEDGVVEPDDQQAQRQHREGLPATRVDTRVAGGGLLHWELLGEGCGG
jgi:hypothetical protein